MLDTRTILILMSISSLLMATTLWVAFAGRFQDGLAKWAMALVLQSVTWALFSFEGAASVFVTATLPDLLLMLSWLLKLASLYEYQHRAVPKSLLRWITPASIVLFAFMAWHGGEVLVAASRAAVYSGATLGIAWMIWGIRDLPRTRIQYLMASLYLVLAVGYLLRLAVSLRMPEAMPAPLTPTPFQTFTFIPGFAIIILSTFCMLLLHKERADQTNFLLAMTDPLTGAYNRRTFMEHAERIFAHATRTRATTSMLMIDIDFFKRINDNYGHVAGDEVLKATVSRVQACLRTEDLLMRYGGEEFCVLLPGTSGDGAATLAERIRSGVSCDPIVIGDQSVSITVSIGVATAGPDVLPALNGLFAEADAALYAAKSAGRDRVFRRVMA